MKIESVEVEAYRLPPATPWEDATNKVDGLEFVVVDLHTDVGWTGTGLSYSVDIGGSALKALIEDYLGNLVVGKNPLHYEQIWYTLERQSRRLGMGANRMAIAAIDIAVWDLIGKIHRQPLYRLLGGARQSIPAYISEINLRADDTPDDLESRIEQYLEMGYRAVKIKIGNDMDLDVERIARAKKRLGPGGRLFADLNQKWTAAEAVQFGSRLDALDLGWLEEPLPYHDVAGHVRLKQALKTPLALGESLHGKQQFLEYLRADAVDIVQADVCFVGGITEWLKIAHLAEAFGRKVAPHFMMELSLHLLCGVTNGYMLENVVGGSLTELGLLAVPITVENGVGIPPAEPGHGIVFDREALAKVKLNPVQLRKTFTGGSK